MRNRKPLGGYYSITCRAIKTKGRRGQKEAYFLAVEYLKIYIYIYIIK